MKKYEELKKALKKAIAAAQEAKTEDDGGTCNFDSPTLDYRAMKMSKAKAIETIESVGLRCFEWTSWSGRILGLVISGCFAGQADCRTRMAEAFHESLVADGVASGMYYQMD